MLQVLLCSSLQEVIYRLFIKAVNLIISKICYCTVAVVRCIDISYEQKFLSISMLFICWILWTFKISKKPTIFVLFSHIIPSPLLPFLLSEKQNFNTVVLSLQQENHVSFRSVTCCTQLMVLFWGMREMTAAPCLTAGHTNSLWFHSSTDYAILEQVKFRFPLERGYGLKSWEFFRRETSQ